MGEREAYLAVAGRCVQDAKKGLTGIERKWLDEAERLIDQVLSRRNLDERRPA